MRHWYNLGANSNTVDWTTYLSMLYPLARHHYRCHFNLTIQLDIIIMNIFQACGKRSGCDGSGFGQYAVGNVTVMGTLVSLWAMIREHV